MEEMKSFISGLNKQCQPEIPSFQTKPLAWDAGIEPAQRVFVLIYLK